MWVVRIEFKSCVLGRIHNGGVSVRRVKLDRLLMSDEFFENRERVNGLIWMV